VIVVGIDPHKQTHTAVALDSATGRKVGELTVKARTRGFERLLVWARDLDEIDRFAVEDGRHVSGSLERHLIAHGETSVRVAPQMMFQARRADRVRGKSDPVDAEAVARAALAHPELPVATLAGIERDLDLLVAHRESLVNERTEKISKLRWLVHDLDPDLAPPLRALDRFKVLARLERDLRALAPTRPALICLELIDRCREITVRANALEQEIIGLVALHAAALTEIVGCGALTAAKILAETAQISRFPTEGHFARYVGTAPLPVASGANHRHRFNRRGNRQLNAAIHRIAITQLRIHEPAKAYFAKKRAEGMSRTEAIRALKRQITRRIYRTMVSMEQPNDHATLVAA
jgi:transposase